MNYIYVVSGYDYDEKSNVAYAYCFSEREALIALAKAKREDSEIDWNITQSEITTYPNEESIKWITTFWILVEKDLGILNVQMNDSIQPVLQKDLFEKVDFHSSNDETKPACFVVTIEVPSPEAWRLMGKTLKYEWIIKAIERISGIKIKPKTNIKVSDEDLVTVGGITRVKKEED